jgi:hypothetical protein
VHGERKAASNPQMKQQLYWLFWRDPDYNLQDDEAFMAAAIVHIPTSRYSSMMSDDVGVDDFVVDDAMLTAAEDDFVAALEEARHLGFDPEKFITGARIDHPEQVPAEFVGRRLDRAEAHKFAAMSLPGSGFTLASGVRINRFN